MIPENIPLELRQRRQWVSFKYGPEKDHNGRPIKLPLIPGTNKCASVSDPSTWRSFEEALAGGNPAYVLTKEDRIILFDLDGDGPEPISEALANQLLALSNTYTEHSVSGQGMHILYHGELHSATALSKQGLQVYGHSRFCIFTGNLVSPDCHTILEASPEVMAALEAQMQEHRRATKDKPHDLVEIPPALSDEAVLELCRQRSAKFQPLWEGRFEGFGYPSHSEADHAMIGLICDCTESNSQAQRLFEMSGMYRPEKAHKFGYSLVTIRANQAQDRANEMWIQKLLGGFEIPSVEREPPPPAGNDRELFTTIPAGLLKELYEAYLANAYRPLKEGALSAALVTALALFSRKYQTETGLALNLWLFLIGPPGCGKEIINKGPNALFEKSSAQMQGVMGGEMRSAAGLEDALKLSPRHLSYVNETDTWLGALCKDKNGTVWGQLRTKLMESYTKGDSVMMLRQRKVEKGEAKEYRMERPCLSVYGDCTPAKFYEAVGTEHVDSGFLPRFTVMEVDNSQRTKERSKCTPFSSKLLDRIRYLSTQAMQADVPMIGGVVQVPMTDEARQIFQDYEDDKVDILARVDMDPLLLNLTTRLAEKVIKVATLCAVCANQDKPQVTVEHMQWALLFVKNTDGRMAEKLASGEHDPATHQQRKVIQTKLDMARYLTAAERERKGFPEGDVRSNPNLVPYRYLADAAWHTACFKSDRRGPPNALKSVLEDLERSGDIKIIQPAIAREKLNCDSMVILILRESFSGGKLF